MSVLAPTLVSIAARRERRTRASRTVPEVSQEQLAGQDGAAPARLYGSFTTRAVVGGIPAASTLIQ